MLRRNSRTAALLLVVLFAKPVFAGGPTREQALQLCEREDKTCTSGRGGFQGNPFIKGRSCDRDRQTGQIDVAAWKKCRDWCEAQHKKCVNDVEQVFGKD
jgi:hypothetical protein